MANVAERQHYKDRSPSWIKLHADVLEDYAFSCLQDASKAHLMLLWLLASRMNNKIPYDLVFITQKLGASGPVDIEVLIQHGFMQVTQDDSVTLAPCTQSAPLEEKRREEGEKRKKQPSAARNSQPSWIDPLVILWSDRVAPVKHGRLGKALLDLHSLYGPEKLEAGLLAYIDGTAGKTRKLEWFADDAVRWIAPTPMPPLVDEHGDLTEYGERMSRPPGYRPQ